MPDSARCMLSLSCSCVLATRHMRTSSITPEKKSIGAPFSSIAPSITSVSGLSSCAPSFCHPEREPLM
eukprot:CAMPEP_0181348662 /NCGR_PEP_ID=MMETSP1106-20121128/302_1 /TAXON_ID=81844 /ORGANISM="Mantoniella antarctica, Strain SL-175" /LENGTH=67 /DNA_ID=CAMNT_0023460983 /DNA_START=364 /DNA_END=567 /DNA_ORIENTATION=-